MTEIFNVSDSNDDEDIIICGEFFGNKPKSNITIINKIVSPNDDNNFSKDENILNKKKKKKMHLSIKT